MNENTVKEEFANFNSVQKTHFHKVASEAS